MRGTGPDVPGVMDVDYEVRWPLHRRHYLTVDEPFMSDAEVLSPARAAVVAPLAAPSPSPVPGRDLAARALLSCCTHQRTSELLGVSRRTVGRMADAAVTETLDEAGAVFDARTCLEETARRSSTAEERAAANAWLDAASFAEQQIGRHHHRAQAGQIAGPVRRTGNGASKKEGPLSAPGEATEAIPVPPAPPARAASPRRHGPRGTPPRKAANGRHPHRAPARRPIVTVSAAVVPVPSVPSSPAPRLGLALDQVDAVTRQQRRILNHSAVIDYVLRRAQSLPMADALAELLADIMEAARTSAAILGQAGGGQSALQ